LLGRAALVVGSDYPFRLTALVRHYEVEEMWMSALQSRVTLPFGKKRLIEVIVSSDHIKMA
jgi:hypothetical protein